MVPGSIPHTPIMTHYKMQEFVFQHLDAISTFWWVTFFLTLAFLVTRYFLVQGVWQKQYKLGDADLIHDYVPDAKSRNILCIDEIRQDRALKYLGAAILAGFFIIFYGWQYNYGTTIQGIISGQSVCWPFFQDCQKFIFLETLPRGYSQMTLYMGLFGVIFLGGYALFANKIGLAHICIGILFVAKLYFMAVYYRYNANYIYYHNAFVLIYLFFPYKRFFCSLTLVYFYFLSTATKIHPGWLLGTYFTSMQTGLPIFPDATTPLWTNLVVVMEMVFVWFLFSKHKWIQRTVLFFFVVFHLYSGILVGYFYPSIVLPVLLIMFGPLFKAFPAIPLTRKSVVGWVFIAAMLGLQMISHVIAGDEKYTMEGNFYGLYMFEANHQCDVRVIDGNNVTVHRVATRNARARCDVYRYWFQASRKFCVGKPDQDKKYRFIVHHSINGGPYYETVNQPDLCSLEYKPFSKNEWIGDDSNSIIIRYPDGKNYYR